MLRRLRKLSIMSTAATTRTSERATWPTVIAARSRWLSRPAPRTPRPTDARSRPSRVPDESIRHVQKVATPTQTTSANAKVKANAPLPNSTSSMRGIRQGDANVSHSTIALPTTRPTALAASATKAVCAAKRRRMAPRRAPNAVRTAISRRWTSARTRNRLATLTTATSSKSTTQPWTTHRLRIIGPTTNDFRSWARVRKPYFSNSASEYWSG